MKTILLAAALLISYSFSAPAFAFMKSETFSTVYRNGELTPHVAELSIDHQRGIIQLSIYNDPCGQILEKAGAIQCLAMASLVQSISVPLQNISSECDSVYYDGTLDQTPFDGMRSSIRVEDHRTRSCHGEEFGRMKVEAALFNPWNQTTTRFSISN